jgi:hypothetical protein
MDPQACLNDLLTAVHDGDCDLASDLLDGLLSWFAKDGFMPSVAVALDKVQDRINERRCV